MFVFLSQASEDGFQGFINAVGGAYIEENEQKIIKVTNLKVPDRQEGERVKYTFTVMNKLISSSLRRTFLTV